MNKSFHVDTIDLWPAVGRKEIEMGAKFKVGDEVMFESKMGVIKKEARVLEVIDGLSEPAYKIKMAWPGGSVSPVFESELKAAAFAFDGANYSLDSMLAANADDEDLCAWLVSAKPGDKFPSIAGPVVCK